MALKDDWVKVINRIFVDSVDAHIPNMVSTLSPHWTMVGYTM